MATATFIGYESTPSTITLTTDARAWFQQKAEALGIDIEVVHKAQNTVLRDVPFADDRKLIIYDIATRATVAQAIGRADYIYYTLPEDASQQPRTMPVRNRAYWRHVDQLGPKLELVSGYQLFELDLGTVWSRYSLSSYRRNNDYGDTMEQVMEATIGAALNRAADEQFFAEWEETKYNQLKELFMAEAKKVSDQRVTNVRNEISRMMAQLSALSTQMVQQEVALKEKQRELTLVETTKNQDDSALEKELNTLLAGKLAERFEFEPNNRSLVMYTHDLHLYSPDGSERTLLGKLKIAFNFQYRTLNIMNLTNRKQNRQHPHIPETGEPCWGGMDSTMRQLLRDAELVPLFELTLQFLQAYNPQDSWGKFAAYWWETQDTQYLQDGEWLTQDEITAKAEEEKKAKKRRKTPAATVQSEAETVSEEELVALVDEQTSGTSTDAPEEVTA